MKNSPVLIICPECKIPFFKMAKEKISFLKWYNGKNWETQVKGEIKSVQCPICQKEVRITKVDK